MAAVGGVGGVKAADGDANAAYAAVKSEIEDKLGVKGQEGSVVHYKTQVVAGTNFFLKLKYGDKFHGARVFRNLQGGYSLHSVKANIGNGDISFF